LKAGFQLKSKLFKDVAEAFLDNYKSNMDAGLPKHSATAYAEKKALIHRYFLPFFGDMGIDRVGKAGIEDYIKFRMTFWEKRIGACTRSQEDATKKEGAELIWSVSLRRIKQHLKSEGEPYSRIESILDIVLMLQSEDAPDPQWVVDAYLKLAELPFGSRPTRTVVGITWGVDEINQLTQPIQDRVLQEMQLESVLGGVSA